MIWREASPTTYENMMYEVTECRVAPVSGRFCPGNMVIKNGKLLLWLQRYHTFHDKFFNYQSNCNYVLAKSSAKKYGFEVMQDGQVYKKTASANCKQAITVLYDGTDVVLMDNLKVMVNGAMAGVTVTVGDLVVEPGKCKYPMIWREADPGCPTTCENMMNEVTECRVEPVSGWFGPGNMVTKNGKCVAHEESTNCFCYGFNYQSNCSYILARCSANKHGFPGL
ncbi:Hypp1718 [Branchiostoma lanceolatum]|uniref:Hypp1718 protein n=1 Tax=Branchiostoma lanceolatum TaxID=7740 RepID=A0A8J9ZK02_BRALA|nr:Hypp1718 [Branchiostoma lanceolatum]